MMKKYWASVRSNPIGEEVYIAADMAQVLKLVKEKLEVYRRHSSGEYQGGMEHTALIKLIDAALEEP